MVVHRIGEVFGIQAEKAPEFSDVKWTLVMALLLLLRPQNLRGSWKEAEAGPESFGEAIDEGAH